MFWKNLLNLAPWQKSFILTHKCWCMKLLYNNMIMYRVVVMMFCCVMTTLVPPQNLHLTLTTHFCCSLQSTCHNSSALQFADPSSAFPAKRGKRLLKQAAINWRDRRRRFVKSEWFSKKRSQPCSSSQPSVQTDCPVQEQHGRHDKCISTNVSGTSSFIIY